MHEPKHRRFHEARGPVAEEASVELFRGESIRSRWATLDPAGAGAERLSAGAWLDRWDRMSAHYLPGRDEVLRTVVRVALPSGPRTGMATAGDPGEGRPRVLDLGAGPGSLAWRLAAAGASVTAVELDPVLRRLGALACGDAVRFTALDLRSPVLAARLAELGPFDAAILVQVLHYLSPNEAAMVLESTRQILRPGGRLVIADEDPDMAREASPEGDPWAAWWRDLAATGLVAGELAARPATAAQLRSVERHVGAGTVLADLRRAGLKRTRRHPAPAGVILVSATA
jgi:SAM-dependent methyltransferase